MSDPSFWDDHEEISPFEDLGDRPDAFSTATQEAARKKSRSRPPEGSTARRRPWWQDFWGWVLPVSLAATVIGCVLLFIGLDSVRLISSNPLGDLLPMLGASLVFALICLVCCILSVAMVINRRRRGMGIATLVTTVLVAPAAGFLTISAGLDQVKQNAENSIGGQTASTIADIAHENDVDLGILEPVVKLLHK